jgi:glycerol kinase
MGKKYVLAIDQGTTNTKAYLFREDGTVSASACVKIKINYPNPGWVQQDPIEIWESVKKVIIEVLLKSSEPKIDAIAITNQRESALLWNRETGVPIGPCITWQCRRTQQFCQELKDNNLEQLIKEKTGLPIDPVFSASKFKWLLENTEKGYKLAKQGKLCAGTVDSWVLYNLTGKQVHACDVSNASRTQLFNIRKLKWDEELLDIFGIPASVLPSVKQSGTLFGTSVPIDSLKGEVPITAMIGDSHAALFGHRCFKPGAVKVTYGTGASLMAPIEKPVKSLHGLATTVAWMYHGKVLYALEGLVHVAGTAIQWFNRIFGLESESAINILATSVKDSGGVYFVPAFVGLGAPHWKSSVRGMITGLLSDTERTHLARATLESIAYQVRDVYDVMKQESGYKLRNVFTDGGCTNSNFLMQFQADITGSIIFRSKDLDMSARGAAYLAGLEIGIWDSVSDIEKLPKESDCFKPRMSENERSNLYRGWVETVNKAAADLIE